MNLVCPRCGKAYGEDDVNVRTDVAHCRGCGRDSSYAGLKAAGEVLKTLREKPLKHFRIELSDRGVGWGDLRLTFCHANISKGLYFFVVAIVLILGIGRLLPPLVSFIIVGILSIISVPRQRTLKVEMIGGKARVWSYWIWRGRGHAFDYDAKTNFTPRLTTDGCGRPLLTRIVIENARSKPLSVRTCVVGEDIEFLYAALNYALPKGESFFEPVPDRPETPEEAATRRVNESAAERTRKLNFLKLLLAIIVCIGCMVIKIWLKTCK